VITHFFKKSEKCWQNGQKTQENKKKYEVKVCQRFLKSYPQYGRKMK